MSAAHTPASGAESIWLCGSPDFLREILAYVLREALGSERVHDARDVEPPALVVPDDARWLVWFAKTQSQAVRHFEPFASQPIPFNLMLIETDGQTMVRRGGRPRPRRLDLSLQELVAILVMPDQRHSLKSTVTEGSQNASHRQ